MPRDVAAYGVAATAAARRFQQNDVRYLHNHEGDVIDERQFTKMDQASEQAVRCAAVTDIPPRKLNKARPA